MPRCKVGWESINYKVIDKTTVKILYNANVMSSDPEEHFYIGVAYSTNEDSILESGKIVWNELGQYNGELIISGLTADTQYYYLLVAGDSLFHTSFPRSFVSIGAAEYFLININGHYIVKHTILRPNNKKPHIVFIIKVGE